jgi:hypothetical protein
MLSDVANFGDTHVCWLKGYDISVPPVFSDDDHGTPENESTMMESEGVGSRPRSAGAIMEIELTRECGIRRVSSSL